MMKPKVYVETTVVSYLAAAPSRDLVVAGHQETTRVWWSRRDRFELFVSQAVVEEASRGNAVAAINRMDYLVTWNLGSGSVCRRGDARPWRPAGGANRQTPVGQDPAVFERGEQASSPKRPIAPKGV